MQRKHWITLALTTAVLAFFPLLHALTIQPLYERGLIDSFATFTGRIAAMLVLPGHVFTAMFIPLPPAKHFSFSGLVIACLLDVFIYGFMLLTVFRLAFRIARPRNSMTPINADGDLEKAGKVETDQPENISRRHFLVAAGSLTGAGLTAAAYPVLVAPGRLTVRKITVPIKGLPPSLAGLKVAQLTDIHHDEWIPRSHVRHAVELTNWLKPDLIALTGDYVTSKPVFIPGVAQELKHLKAPLGAVGCLGNHDYWADPGETRKQFAAIDVRLIDNDRVFITQDRKLSPDAKQGLCVGAVGDLWEDKVEPEKAFHGISAEMPRILLSHNPDVVEKEEIASGAVRVDFMLSGHTHGGQVRLPGGQTPIVPSSFGSRYVHGLVQGPACPINISAGVGLAMLPVRFNVSPEIILITLSCG